MMRILAFATLLFPFLLANIDVFLLAQDKKPLTDTKPADADSTSLIPSAIKHYEITVPAVGEKLQIHIQVQYAVQGQTIFILPAFAAGKVERVIEGKVIYLKPEDRLLPSEEKRFVKLRVNVSDLLDNPEHEKFIVDQIKKRVIDQQSLDQNAKFQIERPNIDPDRIRFTLTAAGLGTDFSPSEIAVANPVSRPLDGVLTFTLDIPAIRKIEKDREYETGLHCSMLGVLPTGPMKVRFERLEMDGQVRYLRSTIDEFRKRVGSMVNPATSKSPDVIIPLGDNGSAETKNQLSSLLRQSLQVSVSTRNGAAGLPLMPFLEKAVDSMLESSKVDMQSDQLRATFLLENQVTISATLGEIKRLTRLDEKGRTDVLKKASDHYYSTKKDQKSNYTGNLNVGYLAFNGGISGSVSNSAIDENDLQIKEEKEKLKQSFDKLLQEFDGKVPTLSGIQIDDTTLNGSTKQIETKFQQNSFIVDYTLQRFTSIPLTGAAESNLSFSDMLRQYSVLKSDYLEMQKIVGAPKQLAEARENIKQVEILVAELKSKSESLDAALAGFEKNSKELLAKMDKQSVSQLQKEVAILKSTLRPLQFSNLDSDFANSIKEMRPPGLDCTGNNGSSAETVLNAQKSWANFLDQKDHSGAFPITEDGKVKMEMCLIPPGKFKMGTLESEKERHTDETQHEVIISKPYYIGKYEVTQEQWEAVMEANPSSVKGAKLPVTHVSWEDCQEFIKKLNAKTNGGYRLPTEAEWEYSCRAGTTTKFSFGNAITDKDANLGWGKIQYVGKFKPNAFGLYDMHGNLLEWCEDLYGGYPEAQVVDPTGPVKGDNRIARGGSFHEPQGVFRSAYRFTRYQFTGTVDLGFRLVKTQLGAK